MKILLLLLVLAPVKRSPSTAILLSIFPGGGQFYTENYIKGAVFATIETTLLGFTVYAHIKAENAKRDKDWQSYEYHSNRRYNLLWWDGIVWALCTADAYISAHFYGFERKGKLEVGFRF
ncbi:MAG: hypothetical protein QMD71_09805 [bacterium]|nr:hypothetical protein [bacterium]